MPAFDRLAREWRESQAAPSVTCAVLRRGTAVHLAGYGDGTPATIYQSGSLGKHFTAAAALLLAGARTGPPLDTPIAPHLPEIPAAWGGITLRHLLSHTAGIPGSGYEALDFSRDYSDPEIARAIAAVPTLDFPPGSDFRYSNAGYVLAGIVIGRATGRFYGDHLRDLIFQPLGMDTATVNTPAAPRGYCRSGEQLVLADSVSPTLNRLADGALSLSVLDLARWDAALHQPWGAAVAAMFDEVALDNGAGSGYGLGWFLHTGPNGRVAGHDGGWQGFSTAMVRYLDAGVSAIVLANLEDAAALPLAHSLALAELGAA